MVKEAEAAASWFADRLRELRSNAGWTQRQLAEKADLTRDGIAQLERGRCSPSWETVLALCCALGVSSEAFRQPPASAPQKRLGRPRKGPPATPDSPPRKRRPTKSG